MSDAAHNRTVDGTRTGIQQRVKLECEREQQEQLLLSVIPAYIAAEVSSNAVDKLVDESDANEFHSFQFCVAFRDGNLFFDFPWQPTGEAKHHA